MTTEQMTDHARESIRMALERKWTRLRATDYAA